MPATFDLLETLEDGSGLSGTSLNDWLTIYKSVELVRVGANIEVRGWNNLRDDRDTQDAQQAGRAAVASNDATAVAGSVYECSGGE